MRQVNGWGFKRITEGPDLNSYYHESFLRGLPELVAEMRRPLKGEGPSRKKNGFGETPNFYKISSIAPLPDVLSLTTPSPPRTGSSASLYTATPETRTVSDTSEQPLAVVSERSHRTKRSPQDVATPHKRRKVEDADAVLFFNDVASVGSWIDEHDEWEPRNLSPLPDHSKSIMGEAAVPRELRIPPDDPHDCLSSYDNRILSKADLSYLAQQNRLLLKQAQVMAGVREIYSVDGRVT
jgi:hypothetical protein